MRVRVCLQRRQVRLYLMPDSKPHWAVARRGLRWCGPLRQELAERKPGCIRGGQVARSQRRQR